MLDKKIGNHVMKKIATIFILLLLCYTAQSHSGRTDSSGGHYNRKTGEYHYHNGGSSSGGRSASSGGRSVSSGGRNVSTVNNDLMVIQEKLNALGFDCGEPDGIMGAKTKQAVKDFQRSKGLTPDGILGPKTRNELGV